MTDPRLFVLTPTDTLFFRDGRPYEQADEGAAHAASLFPPHASTLTGALRAALALGQGWDGRSGWDDQLKAVLGDGPDMDGGTIRFGAPLLLRDGAPLCPAPRALVRRPPFDMLRPGPPVDCDLGQGVRLPHIQVDPRAKPLKDSWLTAEGLTLVLDGRESALDDRHVVSSDALWKMEPRVGIERDRASRTVKRGALYAPVHVRLNDGVALAQPVSGLPADWTPASMAPLGGEHRTAMVEEISPPPTPPRVAAAGGAVLLVLLSPARVDGAWLRPGPIPDWGGAEIVCACLGDPVPIGGWDSRPGNRGPRPLRGFLPAGSTWFLQTPDGWTPPADWIGDEKDARHGFGRFALGAYTDTPTQPGAVSRGDVP